MVFIFLDPTVNKFDDENFAENEKLFVVGVAGCDGGGGRGGGNQRSSQVSFLENTEDGLTNGSNAID